MRLPIPPPNPSTTAKVTGLDNPAGAPMPYND
jgi:hypothetical protein